MTPARLRWIDWSQCSAIQRALCLSVAVHAILLVVIRAGAFSPHAPGSAPEWHLQIAEAADRFAEHGAVASERRAAASPADPAHITRRNAPAADVTPFQSSTEAPAAEPQSAPRSGDDTAASEQPPVPAASPEASDVLTTVAIDSPVTVPAASGRPVTNAERDMVAAHIKSWSRKVRNPDQLPPTLSWHENDRQYTAEFVRRPATSVTDLEKVDVIVTTEENGRSLRSRLQLMRLAFSQFAQLVDHWDQQVQLHDDEVYGRFHSNSEILLGRDGGVMPRFFGQVTTTIGYRIMSGFERRFRDEAFPGGVDTHAQRIQMPRMGATSSAASSAAAAPQDGLRRQFDDDTQIVFYADGSYGWRRLNDPASAEKREPIGSGPTYLVGGRGVRLQVRGAVHGTVLVYSPSQIVVTGNLTYARRTEDTTDYLGLVSDRDVVIADSRVTGPGNLEIDAAIYAHEQFRVDDFDSGGNALLSINGSLSAGTISASEPRFATRVRYDKRFEHTRPPDFPMTGRYEVEQWESQWDPVERPEAVASAADPR